MFAPRTRQELTAACLVHGHPSINDVPSDADTGARSKMLLGTSTQQRVQEGVETEEDTRDAGTNRGEDNAGLQQEGT
jgi:hypothetical protein